MWETYYGNRAPTDRPVGSFWWKSIIKLLPTFKEMAISCTVGQGSSTLFWHDKWTHTALKQQFPELFTFSMDGLLSVREAADSDSFQELFHRPLSVQAFAQFNQAKNYLDRSSVLVHLQCFLMGVPGKQFWCKKGVRQGDPLSPLIFVLAADILQSVFNESMKQQLISPLWPTAKIFL